MHVVATAGHVDHGKSTLVRTLTGTDPDRWAEEQERGLTIDLGFAATTLASGRALAFVDVPGHVRFLKNMLAGVGAVDACLFVVDAVEGWKPQSEEHLRILELLGVGHGLVVLTKVTAAGAERTEASRAEVADRVAGTFLAGADVVPVDALAGEGMAELRAALDRLLAATPAAVDRGRPRLWIDRSFAVRGAGAVVTGTLTGGTLRVGDPLLLLPRAGSVVVRGLQRHDVAETTLAPGNRAAVNLRGVAHQDIVRGDVLVTAGQWHLTRRVDANLEVLTSLGHRVSRRGAYLAYLGSGEHAVRLRVLGSESLAPGDSGPVRLHLPVALPLVPGDRFVLRESGRAETVGGGEVLDVDPVLAAPSARPDRSVARVVAERGWVDVEHLARLTGERRAPDVSHWAVDPDRLHADRDALTARLDAGGESGIELATLDERDRAVLDLLDGVVIERGRAFPPGRTADTLADHPYLAALAADPFHPPAPDGVDRAELRRLVESGAVVESDGVWFAASAVDAAARSVAELLAAEPAGVTASAVRDALGTSRKFALPLLGALDRRGVTRRRGDLRIAGPRLPAA